MREPHEYEETDQVPIRRLMGEIGITTLANETERRIFLDTLSGDAFLDGIARVSSFARHVPILQNELDPEHHVVVFEDGNSFEDSTSIQRIPLYHEHGKEILREVPDVAKSIDDLAASGSFLRLMIALAHVQKDGNGAASRFYGSILTDGYSGTEEDDVKYQDLLRSSNALANSHPERSWTGSFAKYYGESLIDKYDMPFPIQGYTHSQLSKKEIKELPIMQSGFALYFLESGFAAVFATELIARSGRDIRDFTIELKGEKFIDTDRLLMDMKPDEADLVAEVGDRQKSELLRAVIEKYSTGHHPAFEDYDISKDQFANLPRSEPSERTLRGLWRTASRYLGRS
jgi:hypothetical protein